MLYRSTRGTGPSISFEKVLFSGYAEDGGLLVPESIPKLDPTLLKKWKQDKVSYTEIVHYITRLYVAETEISDSQLSECIKKAYAKFSRSEVIPVKKLERGKGQGTISVAELYHGRTASFKDVAMSLLGQFLEYFMEKRNGRVTALVGTSGDTGSAAIEAVRGLSKVSIIVLYPRGKVTEVQELQMRSYGIDDNVHLFEVEGTSDDTDVPILQCFPNPSLTSLNSVNWARIMVQICHYVYLYVIDETEDAISVVVPSGAGGNLTAGVYAKLMGVPLELYAAVNENSCVHDLLTSGILEMDKPCVQTPANAMDICNPYNVERILFLASNSEIVSKIMTGTGPQVLPVAVHDKLKSFVRSSKSAENRSIYETIRYVWNISHYLVCPHTATGVKLVLDKIQGDCYVLATASPFKFPEAFSEAGISTDVDVNQLLTALRLLPLKEPKLMKKGEDWLKILKQEIALIEAK